MPSRSTSGRPRRGSGDVRAAQGRRGVRAEHRPQGSHSACHADVPDPARQRRHCAGHRHAAAKRAHRTGHAPDHRRLREQRSHTSSPSSLPRASASLCAARSTPWPIISISICRMFPTPIWKCCSYCFPVRAALRGRIEHLVHRARQRLGSRAARIVRPAGPCDCNDWLGTHDPLLARPGDGPLTC